jgi:hypothetical protein
MPEQRQIPRYQVDCPVTFVVDDVPGTGTVFNLSEEGCAIETVVAVPADGYVSLCITLPGDVEPVVVDLARVRWVTRTEFGCEFRILGRSARKRLQRFLVRDRAA